MFLQKMKQFSSMIQVFWSQMITVGIQESNISLITSSIFLTHHASPYGGLLLSRSFQDFKL